MRLSSFLFALCLVVGLALAESVSSRQSSNVPQIPLRASHAALQTTGSNYDSTRMLRRAQIVVVSMEQADLNKAELESLRQRVAQAELAESSIWFVDPEIRRQLVSQVQLMKELLRFAAQQQSDRGKSATAVEVQRRLNRIQGQTMCEACHSGIVARNNVEAAEGK